MKDPISKKNLDGYGASIIPWEEVHKRLREGFTQAPKTGGPNRHTAWLATVRPDGKPHVMPIGVLFLDDAFYSNTGPRTRKARNIARNPNSVITIATDDFDIVAQGPAKRIVDPARLQRIADAFKKGGWEPTVVNGGLTAKYSAPSAGPPPWNVYEVKPETIFALATSEPYGATRWNFQANIPRKMIVKPSQRSASSDFKIVPANPEDIDIVLGILDEAAAWIIEQKIPSVWIPGGFSREIFLEQISRGEVHVALIDENPAGTITLQWADLIFWGEQQPDSGYVHKLAVRPAYKGQKIGVEMLKWAEAAARKAGKKFLRLNCLAADRKIRDYYESVGFLYKGDIARPRGVATLYEKEL